MAVYILGAGASCCTDAYPAYRYVSKDGNEYWDPDYRPPLMTDFFQRARARNKCARAIDQLKPILEAVGLGVRDLSNGPPSCPNVEHVFSLCYLLEQTLGEWVSSRSSPPSVSDDLTLLCERTRGWPLFGEAPVEAVTKAASALWQRSRKIEREGVPQDIREYSGAYADVCMVPQSFIDAIREVYSPRGPYRSRAPVQASLCSNYRCFYDTIKAGDTIITFNYDFLLDRVLEDEGRFGSEAGEALPFTFDVRGGRCRYLKLHGSVLWYVKYVNRETAQRFFSRDPCGTVRFVRFNDGLSEVERGSGWLPEEILPQGHGTFATEEEASVFRQQPKDEEHRVHIEPLIIPPTVAKDFSRPEIKRLWCLAVEALAGTDQIYVMGYSFPPTDTHVTQKLTEPAGASRSRGNYRGVQLEIVDKPGAPLDDNEIRALKARVCDAFPGADEPIVARHSGRTIGFAEWVSRNDP